MSNLNFFPVVNNLAVIGGGVIRGDHGRWGACVGAIMDHAVEVGVVRGGHAGEVLGTEPPRAEG